MREGLHHFPPDSGEVRHSHEVLGVGRDAPLNENEIRSARRQRVLEVRNQYGENSEAEKEINAAADYLLGRNRGTYDDGPIPEPTEEERQAAQAELQAERERIVAEQQERLRRGAEDIRNQRTSEHPEHEEAVHPSLDEEEETEHLGSVGASEFNMTTDSAELQEEDEERDVFSSIGSEEFAQSDAHRGEEITDFSDIRDVRADELSEEEEREQAEGISRNEFAHGIGAENNNVGDEDDIESHPTGDVPHGAHTSSHGEHGGDHDHGGHSGGHGGHAGGGHANHAHGAGHGSHGLWGSVAGFFSSLFKLPFENFMGVVSKFGVKGGGGKGHGDGGHAAHH